MTDHDATGRCALLIRNAAIADGTGAPVFTADVAVEGERIAAVGELAGWQADEAIGRGRPRAGARLHRLPHP